MRKEALAGTVMDFLGQKSDQLITTAPGIIAHIYFEF
jgi:hypothetical protein